jgi:hypothetical protein
MTWTKTIPVNKKHNIACFIFKVKISEKGHKEWRRKSGKIKVVKKGSIKHAILYHIYIQSQNSPKTQLQPFKMENKSMPFQASRH